MIYSTQFLVIKQYAGQVDYVVPPGMVAIVRQFTVCTRNQAYANASLTIEPSDTVAVVLSVLVPGDPPRVFADWQGRVVLTSGQAMRLTSDNPLDMTLSGYLLDA